MPCFKPYYRQVNDGTGVFRTFPCPCGHCPYCRYQNRRIWSFRLEVEKLYFDKSVFLTLTYDPSKWDRTTLWPPHLTAFWKRLRKRLGEHKIKYFSCGEYSQEIGNNPHYHAILYGLSKDDLSLIESCWNYGFVHVGEVNEKTIKYVAGYVMKKLGKDKDRYKDKDCFPEFIRCSQGIGLRFIEDFPTFASSVVWNGRTQYLGRYLMNKLKYKFYPYDDLETKRNPISQVLLEELFTKFHTDQMKHLPDFVEKYELDYHFDYYGIPVFRNWKCQPISLLQYSQECDTLQFRRDFLAKFKLSKRIQNEKIEIQPFTPS